MIRTKGDYFISIKQEELVYQLKAGMLLKIQPAAFRFIYCQYKTLWTIKIIRSVRLDTKKRPLNSQNTSVCAYV